MEAARRVAGCKIQVRLCCGFWGGTRASCVMHICLCVCDDDGARSRMHAGPSNIQFPRLLGDSVCSGKIQNARRTVQHTVSTPFGGFCMLRQDPKCTPDRPTYSFHAFWGILYAPAGYRMRGAGCKDTGNRRLQQNPRFFRIQNPGLQILFPLPQPRLTTQLPKGSHGPVHDFLLYILCRWAVP